jgi:Rod binding domain-containing protein
MASSIDWNCQKPGDPAKARDAAQQFEALMLAQILKGAGESGGLFGSGSDGSAGTVMDMATQQFALAIARQGGLGLADLVAQGLESRQTTAPAGPDSPGPRSPAGSRSEAPAL